ncbi:ABC transporter ATP-binding protein [Enterococcus sp. LJL99]
MIEFNHVTKKYGDQLVLKEMNLTIADGEFFVLVGPSGSGKTTTLKMINRLIEPTTGDIYFNGKRLIDYPLRELRLTIGYVLQQIALFPNLTVAENIELIPEMKKWSKEQRRERVTELLQMVQLAPEDYAHRKPAELSGGEQQRIGILRAIAAKPDIILMDEPFSALDPISREQLQTLIKELHQELASTIVFVTHDMNEAVRLGDRICIMNEGSVVQTDTPDEIRRHPISDFVAHFFKEDAANIENYCVVDLIEFLEVSEESRTNHPLVAKETNLVKVIQQINAEGPLMVVVAENQQAIIDEQVILRFIEAKMGKVEAEYD